VKGVRIGMDGQKPPTTRIVVDLEHACRYELNPSSDGKLVLTLHTRQRRRARAFPSPWRKLPRCPPTKSVSPFAPRVVEVKPEVKAAKPEVTAPSAVSGAVNPQAAVATSELRLHPAILYSLSLLMRPRRILRKQRC
jgi:hypothetical protein